MTSTAVIFDLDGTLVDPAGAITGGIAAALEAHGIEVPDEQTLKSFIGPPLAASLKALPGVTEELVPRLIEHYREGYIREGLAASVVYPGIRELLEALRAEGALLAAGGPGPSQQPVRSVGPGPGPPRPEPSDLHQLPCCFHSGSDRSPTGLPAPFA